MMFSRSAGNCMFAAANDPLRGSVSADKPGTVYAIVIRGLDSIGDTPNSISYPFPPAITCLGQLRRLGTLLQAIQLLQIKGEVCAGTVAATAGLGVHNEHAIWV